MTMTLSLRRGLVTVGVAAALLLAAVAVRTAADWTAASAPLTVAPASLSSIRAALQGEQDRSAALQAQLTSLEAASGDLGPALVAAKVKIATEATTAATLQADLVTAKAKLAALQAALARASAARAPVATTSGAVSPVGGGEANDD